MTEKDKVIYTGCRSLQQPLTVMHHTQHAHTLHMVATDSCRGHFSPLVAPAGGTSTQYPAYIQVCGT